jgi:hypothetical protein
MTSVNAGLCNAEGILNKFLFKMPAVGWSGQSGKLLLALTSTVNPGFGSHQDP